MALPPRFSLPSFELIRSDRAAKVGELRAGVVLSLLSFLLLVSADKIFGVSGEEPATVG